MDTSTWLNIGAVVLSAIAVVVSTRTAFAQIQIDRNSNHLIIINEILNEFRSGRFHEDHEVVRRLPEQFDPTLGLSGLPDDVLRVVYNVLYFYQKVGILVALRIFDQDQMISLLRGRMLAVWASAQPFVQAEREIGNMSGKELLRVLEEFAEFAKSSTGPPLTREFKTASKRRR